MLVQMRAVSLNYRDLDIVSGTYIRGALAKDTIPASDGAGEVAKIGAGVSRFKIGDRVTATYLQGTPPAPLGSPLDGVLAEYAVFEESGLIHLPAYLSFAEAATLPCAAVTAWNALFWGRRLRPGETVLTLGTGGVSIFAVQLAALAGARVIVTSSSDAKLAKAMRLGATDSINYVSQPHWSTAVLKLTHGRGAEQIIETAALGTLPQSYEAVSTGGEIALIGVLSKRADNLAPYPLMPKNASMRGIVVGRRQHFEELLRSLSFHELRPAIDSTFAFDDAHNAYRRLASGRHFGKVVIAI